MLSLKLMSGEEAPSLLGVFPTGRMKVAAVGRPTNTPSVERPELVEPA